MVYMTRAGSTWEGSGQDPRLGGWFGRARSGHLAGRSQVGFKRGGLRRLRGAGVPPTWQQPAAAVGPGPPRVQPGWTGRPPGTARTSPRQGPRPGASGSGGGTRARCIRARPGETGGFSGPAPWPRRPAPSRGAPPPSRRPRAPAPPLPAGSPGVPRGAHAPPRGRQPP